jgi:drug/metabolite transporter (DMT)-like permease
MLDRRRLLIIFTMIFSAAVTPIAIRITQGHGVPSLVIVLIRLWLVSFALLPWIWLRYRQEIRRLTWQQILLSGISGFWLALNLLLLFVSLEYTSVLMTSLLRRTTPMWIVLPEIFLFGVIFSRRFWFSLALTLVGVGLVGLGGLSAIEAGSDPLLGGALALIGAFCFGAYLLIGRKLNNVLPPLLYSFLVFLSAAIVTSIFVAASETPVTGYSARGYLWVVVVTILAQAMGHLIMNLALQHFTATALAIILQIAVVGSAAIALFLFGEVPSLLQIVGSALVIYGVLVATIEQTQARWKHRS